MYTHVSNTLGTPHGPVTLTITQRLRGLGRLIVSGTAPNGHPLPLSTEHVSWEDAQRAWAIWHRELTGQEEIRYEL